MGATVSDEDPSSGPREVRTSRSQIRDAERQPEVLVVGKLQVARMGLLLQPADGLTKDRFTAGLREA